MDELPNPYAAQVEPQAGAPPLTASSAPATGDFMLVQVIVLAILQIFVGVLEILMGGLLAFYAFLFPKLMAMDPDVQAMPPAQLTILVVYCSVAGGLIVLSAILRIVSGIRLFYYRGRLLTFISLFVGLVGIASCYCSITSIGLIIYGCIILFHPAVKYAFELSQNGWTAQQVRDHFAAARLGMSTVASGPPQ